VEGWRRLSLVLVGTAFLAGLALALPGTADPGSLRYNTTLFGTFETVACDGSAPASARCFLVLEKGAWPGVGTVSLREIVVQSGITDAEFCEPQSRAGVLTFPTGTISFAASGTDCPATRELLGGYRAVIADWQVTGGTGRFAGITGDGEVNVRPEDEGDEVNSHFSGSLAAAGLTFDVAPPRIAMPRTLVVRAKRPVAVRYRLPVATDGVDGRIPVQCAPRSGSRFPLGRTTVACSATDKSANTAVGRFAVVVRRPGT
jgi:hypothetical protein